MYQGKHGNAKARKGRRRYYIKGRMAAMILSTVLLLALAIGGTVAWLSTKDAPITNTFTPSHVACSVTENCDGTTKSNVNVTNTGDTEAYSRVKLVTYRVNEQNQHIGGTAEIPEFTPGDGWVKSGDYYYYTLPVAANGGTPANPLIGESGIAQDRLKLRLILQPSGLILGRQHDAHLNGSARSLLGGRLLGGGLCTAGATAAGQQADQQGCHAEQTNQLLFHRKPSLFWAVSI